jgi:hypothetical protein
MQALRSTLWSIPPRTCMADRTVIPILDEELEVDVLGSGDPIVIVHTALAADELRPLAGLRASATPGRLPGGDPTSQGRNATGMRWADPVAAGGQNSQQTNGHSHGRLWAESGGRRQP